MLTTQSLPAIGDFDLTNQYEAKSYEFFFGHSAGLWRQSEPKPDNGKPLRPHNPGLSVWSFPDLPSEA